jgi:propanol-preferring alcohol dehydrogenase
VKTVDTSAVPERLKAAVLHDLGAPLRIEELPFLGPGPGQILTAVAACGICETDLHAANGDWPVKSRVPSIPGLEGHGPGTEVSK